LSEKRDVPDEPLKVVLDTNLFVSGLLKGKVTLMLIESWINDAFAVVTSEELIEELAEVVARPRLRAYIPKRDADKLIELIYRKAIVVKPSERPPLCRDPDDYPVLGSAIAGQADFIVTGDDDLKDDPRLKQEMMAFGVRIMSVPEFLVLLETDSRRAGSK
jgi:putative PIN family toxin of toxin-antitoxin system